LITSSNSINFQSFDNNSKTVFKPANQNSRLFIKNEINLDLQSLKDNNNNTSTTGIYNTNKHSKDSEIDVSNSINSNHKVNINKKITSHFTIDQPIKIQLLNKKRNHEVILDRNDISKIKSDLCPDRNYQEYKVRQKIIPSFSNAFLSSFENLYNEKKLNKNELIEELKFQILKRNLESKKCDSQSDLEKKISKEIFFHQLFRLFTCKNNQNVKSSIIKNINEILADDNISECLLFLSKIQILKDNSINKRKMKKKNLIKLVEMISNNNFMHPYLNDCKYINFK